MPDFILGLGLGRLRLGCVLRRSVFVSLFSNSCLHLLMPCPVILSFGWEAFARWPKILPYLCLARNSADARGPFRFGRVGRLLAGRQAGRVGLRRQHGPALGRGHGGAAP
jgi:hypothetical protein